MKIFHIKDVLAGLPSCEGNNLDITTQKKLIDLVESYPAFDALRGKGELLSSLEKAICAKLGFESDRVVVSDDHSGVYLSAAIMDGQGNVISFVSVDVVSSQNKNIA